jgi:superfamily II DNA/RNA helicase
VAARGLDVKGVELVINYSLGLSLDMYVHRCGRCGRAGQVQHLCQCGVLISVVNQLVFNQSGIAHSFVVDGDESMAPALVALMARTRQHVSEELREVLIRF